MLATVAVTVATHDLAQGVLVGVLLSGIFFARKVARIFTITSSLSEDGTTRTYVVTGQVFFASADAFAEAFDLREAIERVVIDVTGAHVWDLTAVAALDKVVLKFRREGTEVGIVGMNAASATLVDTLATHDRQGASAGAGLH
jgi:SulP family sulfate permease